MGLKQPMMYEMPPPPAVDPEVAKKEAESTAKLEAEKKKAISNRMKGRGGTILTQEIPPDVFGDRSVAGVDKRLKEAFTGVPILEKTSGGKLTIGSRPVTEKEIISVPERDAMAKRLKDTLLKLDLGFLPKKIATPLEFGQKIIRGTTKKDGGRIPYKSAL